MYLSEEAISWVSAARSIVESALEMADRLVPRGKLMIGLTAH